MSTKTNLQARRIRDILDTLQKQWDETAFPNARGGKCVFQVDTTGDTRGTLRVVVTALHVNAKRSMFLESGIGVDFHDAINDLLDRRIAALKKRLPDAKA